MATGVVLGWRRFSPLAWEVALQTSSSVVPVTSLWCGLALGTLLGSAACVTIPDEVVPEPALADAASFPDTASVPDAAPLPSDAAAPCPTDTVTFAGFCMDRYEAPNQAGVPPLAMRTASDGVAFCTAAGKRLCTEAEWVRACQGPAGLPFPYGKTYQRSRCNDDKVWKAPSWTVLGTWPSAAALAEAKRLYQADPSGSRSGCAAAEGVQDLTGNVAEWVVRSFPNSNNYAHVMKGCYWSGCYGGAPPSCSFTNPAHPGSFRTYEAGFRCCLTR